MPDKTSHDEPAWFNYYQDQLDAYKGAAVYAPDDSYSKEAKEGFQRAMLDWENKKDKAPTKSDIDGAGIGCGIGLIALLIELVATSGQ